MPVLFTVSSKPIRYLARPESVAPEVDAAARDALRLLEQQYQKRFPGDEDLAGRIASYELAARMQLSVPLCHGVRSYADVSGGHFRS